MANKVYKDATSALEGVLHDGMMVEIEIDVR